MPSFTKPELSRRSSEASADSFEALALHSNGEESTRSNLDSVRYEECVYYYQEVSLWMYTWLFAPFPQDDSVCNELATLSGLGILCF